MNKELLLKVFGAVLTEQMEGFQRSAKSAHAEATAEDNKAESKYDTRALEASYIAEGQTRAAIEVEEALNILMSFQMRSFEKGDKIALGALVEIEGTAGPEWYFLGPCAGGTELCVDGMQVTVLTENSPLGSVLIGKKRGEKGTLKRGKSEWAFRIANVW